jgi:tetratricopeptide (TPR) repeat protein
VRCLLFEGVIATRDGDRDRAMKLLGAAVDSAPVGGAAYHVALWNRHILHRDALRHEDALADLHALERAGNRSLDLQVRIASHWRKLGRGEEARSRFERYRSEADTEAKRRELCSACGASWEADWLETAACDALGFHPENVHFLLAAAAGCTDQGRHGDALPFCDRALRSDARSHRARELRAKVLARLDRAGEALEAARSGLEVEPSCPRCRAVAAAALKDLGRTNEALEEVQHGLEIQPRDVELLLTRSAILLELGKPEDALAAARLAVLLNPRETGARHNCSRALQALGRPREALAENAETLRIKPDRAAYHNQRGLLLEETGDRDGALSAYTRAIELGEAGAHQNRGLLLRELGRREEAMAEYEQMLKALPDHAMSHLGMAASLLSLDRDAEAEAPCRRAIELDPALFDARYNLVTILVRLGRWEEVPAAVEAALALPGVSDVDKAYLYEKLGHSALEREDHAAAAAGFLKVIDLGQGDVPVFHNAAFALYSQGKDAEALDVLDRAERTSAVSAKLLMLRAAILRRAGKDGPSREAAERALELEPNHLGALRTRADIFFRQGREVEAIGALEALLRSHPDDPDAPRMLGMLLVTASDPVLRDHRRAAELARQAVQAAPADFRAWTILGAALCGEGKWKEGLDALRRSLELDNGGSAYPRYFAAIAEKRAGDGQRATALFEQAMAWRAEHAPDDAALARLHAEAGRALGRPEAGE